MIQVQQISSCIVCSLNYYENGYNTGWVVIPELCWILFNVWSIGLFDIKDVSGIAYTNVFTSLTVYLKTLSE
jgi:hypothetical protein